MTTPPPKEPSALLAATPLTLVDLYGKPSFDASSLMEKLLANGQRAGTLPRPIELTELEPPPPPTERYSLRHSLRSMPNQGSAVVVHPPPSATADFPRNLADDARMKGPMPRYSSVPPSIASSRRRRRDGAQMDASPLLLASIANASGLQRGRLPQHARMA